jgi:toxin ParE1/3/4
MSRRLDWTSRALRRVEEIGDYIAKDSPVAAEKVTDRLQAAPESLRAHPAIGRTGRIAGTRELVLADIPYIIAYRVTETSVEILTVMHTSQRWPEAL